MASVCPHNGDAKDGGAKVRKSQLDDTLASSPTASSGTPTSAATAAGSPTVDGSQEGMMKELLGEANKMLRGLGGGQPGDGPVATEDKAVKRDTKKRLEEMQAELRQMQRDAGSSLRVLRIARV